MRQITTTIAVLLFGILSQSTAVARPQGDDSTPSSASSKIQLHKGWPELPFGYEIERHAYMSMIYVSKGEQGDDTVTKSFDDLLQKNINKLGPLSPTGDGPEIVNMTTPERAPWLACKPFENEGRGSYVAWWNNREAVDFLHTWKTLVDWNGFVEFDFCVRTGLATLLAYCILRLEYDEMEVDTVLKSQTAANAARVCDWEGQVQVANLEDIAKIL